MARQRGWRIAVVPLGLAAVGAFVVWRSFRAAPIDVFVERVSAAPIRAYLDERGTTRVPRRIVIAMPYDGRAERIELEVGDEVREGQELARLVPRDGELELAAAEAVVARLRASLAENADVSLESTALTQTDVMISAMKAMAAAAAEQKRSMDAWMRYYQANAERTAALAQTEAESRDALELAETNREASRSDLDRQTKNVEYQNFMVQAIELAPRMIRDYLGRKRLRGDVIRQELAEAEVKCDQARVRVERAAVRSPIDGVVLRRAVDGERYLASGAELLVLGDLGELEVESEMLTQEAARVRAGDPAEIYGPAVGRDAGKGFDGRVLRVEPEGFTKVSSLGVEEQRTRVIAVCDGLAERPADRGRLGAGFRVRLRVFTASRDAALAVPRSALFRDDAGGWALFVAREGRARRCSVEIGIMNDESVEITRGIDAGELVVVAPESALVDGARVRVRESASPRAGVEE
ncbi:MAG: HlyD family efflux transporter periplasmic adaptor subunit [Planctomycetes bacterium]|nr:HlyD family efflux transporter periplasmic adaptor subunit [Planctomycetota bacterium]